MKESNKRTLTENYFEKEIDPEFKICLELRNKTNVCIKKVP